MRSHGSGCFNTSQTVALQRWEAEGGAFGASTSKRPEYPTPLSEQERYILQCLGAAVLSQWNGLPTRIQHELFGHSLDAAASCDAAQLKRRIARFLHRHKDDAGSAR